MNNQPIDPAVVEELKVMKKPTSKSVKEKVAKEKTVVQPFVVLEDKDNMFNSRVQINSNDIKHTMRMHDSMLVTSHSFIPDSLTGQARERAEAESRFNILDLLNDGKNCNWIFNRGSKEQRQFIDTLMSFDKKFEDFFNSVQTSDKVSFRLLPYFFKQGALLATLLDSSTWIGMKVTESKIKRSFFGPYFEISGKGICHDGKSFIESSVSHAIGAFDGEKTLAELGVKFPEQDKALYNALVERGKKYEQIHKAGPSYLNCEGSVVRRSYWHDHSFPATGRVMIDRMSMISIDPNYEKYFGHNQYNDSEGAETDDFSGDESAFFIMSPYCYGFSFTAKQWGEFRIDQLSEISFREDSYKHLVLNNETKDILFSLTDTLEHGKDLIDGKGGGCIFLLHGTPGVGKTLTAETIAETLKRPLYMVSVGELGTDVCSLEANLRNILQISASWNAVLLIDEVDIFLEKRDLDIHRNALVGVFLRLLEYYNGILFLTTNRVEQIDPAFYSRISLAIKYPALSADAREQIWSGQLSLYQIDLSAVELNSLALNYDLNGRQIKNCVRIVNSLSRYRKTTPTLEDFLAVVNKVEEFNKTLQTN